MGVMHMDSLETVDAPCACGRSNTPDQAEEAPWYSGLTWKNWVAITLLAVIVFTSSSLGMLDVELRILCNTWW
jgi:hypothetical protein